MAPTYDPYEQLGVDRHTTDAQIAAAFTRAAAELAASKASGDTEADARMARVWEAYEIVGDPRRRFAYDMTGDPEGEILFCEGPGYETRI